MLACKLYILYAMVVEGKSNFGPNDAVDRRSQCVSSDLFMLIIIRVHTKRRIIVAFTYVSGLLQVYTPVSRAPHSP